MMVKNSILGFKYRVHKVFTYRAGFGLYNVMIVFFRRQVLKEKLSIFKLKAISNYSGNILRNIYLEEIRTTFGPKEQGINGLEASVKIPELNIYEFKNALVNSRTSAILVNESLVFESYNSNERFSQGMVKWHDNRHAVINEYEEECVRDGFFLAGLGSFNWYHWLIEILPKALFIDRVPTKNVLVDGSIAAHPTMLASLNQLLPDAYNIIYLSPKKNYRIEQLYLINALSYVPYMLRQETSNYRVGDFFTRGDVIKVLRHKIVIGLKEGGHSKKRRVYMERSHHRVPINQCELVNELAQLDFEIVKIDELSLKEQIELFNNAEIIVGVSGAAFANLLFANQNCSFVCIMPKSLLEFSCFSNLAAILDIDLNYIYYNLDNGVHHYSNNFLVSISEVIESVKSLVIAKVK